MLNYAGNMHYYESTFFQNNLTKDLFCRLLFRNFAK